MESLNLFDQIVALLLSGIEHLLEQVALTLQSDRLLLHQLNTAGGIFQRS